MAVNESNWLDSKLIQCKRCGQEMHWVWHSPMYDETFFYCTQCPKRVGVSHYDRVALSLRKLATQEAKQEAGKHFTQKFLALVEENLFFALVESEPGRDVWPPDSANENADQQSLTFPMESLIKTKNIWRVTFARSGNRVPANPIGGDYARYAPLLP